MRDVIGVLLAAGLAFLVGTGAVLLIASLVP